MNLDLLLQNIGELIGLDTAETAFFTSLLHPMTLKRKAYLLQAGEICLTESFITKGCVRTYTIDHNGFEHIVSFGVENWWVGDLYSFVTATPAAYFIDALEDTELWQLSKPALDTLYKEVPKFERFFRIRLQNAFIAQQRRINQNLSFTAAQRYLYFIEKYPGLEQRIPQKQVAAYLGITPEFLSMIRRKLAGK
jgi:CRP-like cAMP-binding protein